MPPFILLAVPLLGAGSPLVANEQATRPTGEGHASIVSQGWIGAHQLTLPARPVPASAGFPVKAEQTDLIAITEVYPDSPTPVSYHYLVTGPGLAPFERHSCSRGFGPVTYFLPAARQPASRTITLTNLGGADHPPRILGVRAVTRDELDRAKRDDRFTLMGTVINPASGMSEDEQVARLAGRLPTDPGRNITRAFSCEIYYANTDAMAVRRQLETARQRARQHAMPVLLGMVSWWNGTPRNVPDGLGGKFDDLRYQQICYTPNAVHPENERLRELLGERYNPHYCLTTPNIWANTPWLTMNSPHLNAYRAKRMREAVDSLTEIAGGDISWISGIFLENEPRYWDTQSTQGTPQWCGERWADFNPCTVTAAAGDGVTLNPSDGLSLEELTWLQRNAGRYFQDTVDMLRQALEARGLIDRFPIYTHSLQLAILFPGAKINQTPSDWARAIGAHTGIEGIWSRPSDYERLREWGPWCNLNREETDGHPLDTHLWDLRTSYAMGAGFYNSYNWHVLKDDAYFAYARDFLTGLPVVTLPPAVIKPAAADTVTFTPPGGLQAFTHAIVPVAAMPEHGAQDRLVALAVDGGPHRTWFSARQALPAEGRHLLTFTFPVPAEVKSSATGSLRLLAYDANGAALRNAAAFAGDAARELRLAFDFAQCRTHSQLVIQWQQAAPSRREPGRRGAVESP